MLRDKTVLTKDCAELAVKWVCFIFI